MEKIALFPGTFDPITIGHVDIIRRSLMLFDKLYVGIGDNSQKTTLFSPQTRLHWLEEIFKKEPKIESLIYEGLTVDCCKRLNANFILRGVRFVSDFEYEKSIADMNRTLDPNIETFFLTCIPAYTSIASTIVRDVIKNGGDASAFLPDVVIKDIYKK